MKVLCHLTGDGVEEEAMFEPTSTVGRIFVPGSWVVKGAMVGVGGVFEGASSALSELRWHFEVFFVHGALEEELVAT